ncbi:MAG: CbtA family protein [Rhodoferax sp.]
MIFQRLIWAALASALLVASAQTALQQWQTVPIILAAEVFEDQKVEAPAPAQEQGALAQAQAPGQAHEHGAQAPAHEHGAMAAAAPAQAEAEAAHEHGGDEEWAPADGLERTFWTWVANVLHAFAMALLLFAALGVSVLRGSQRPMWLLAAGAAAAGWLSLHLWPALGLHAEIPGMDAAPLGARQTWWALAVASSAAACAALAWMRPAWRWLVAAALLALPFAVGAPHLGADPLAGFSGEAQAQLRLLGQQFVVATHILAVTFWACMGLVGGWTFARWVRPALLAQLGARAQGTGALEKAV